MVGWWWDRSQFVSAQQDEGFQAWVTKTELGLELEGFYDLVPELENVQGGQYNENSLLLAEKRFLQLFPDAASLKTDEATHMHFRFIGFIGHLYVHHLECKWVYQPKVENYAWREGGPAIERPWTNTTLYPVMAAPRVAAHRRTGEEWDFVFKNNRKDYLDWVEQGRPVPS